MEKVLLQTQLQSKEINVKQNDSQKGSSLNNSVDNTAKAVGESSECHVCMLAKTSGNKIEGLEQKNGKEKSSSSETYNCGVCSETFCTICRLHHHLTTYHLLSGSYQYDYFIRTAFPKYESLCQFTQTEDLNLNREGVFDSAERKRHCTQLQGHEGAIISKSKVRKKAKVKKESHIPETVKKVLDNVQTTEACWRKVKVEAAEVVKNELTVEIAGSDGYNTDRTDDYFDTQEELLSDVENKNVDACHQTDTNKDISVQNVRSQTEGKSRRKSRDFIDIKSKCQNHCATNRKSKKVMETVQSSGKNNENVIANLGERMKFGAKFNLVNTAKKAKQKSDRKKNFKKTKDKSVRESLKHGYHEYKFKVNQENDKVLDHSMAEERNETGEKNVVERNRSHENHMKHVEDRNQSDKEHIECRDQSDENSPGNKIQKWKEGIESNTCEICGATFTVKQGLLRHEQLKHVDQMNFKCEQCDKKFMRNFNLQKHITHVHGGSKGHKLKVRKEQTDKEEVVSASEEVKPDKMFTEISQDKADIEEDENKQMVEHVEVKTRRKRRTIEEVKSLKTPHTCELCGHTMPKSKMDVHKRLHTGERPFICTVCGKGLISQNKLSRHMLIHGEVKRHTCEVCGAGFHMKYKLRMHMHIHTGKKPYLCSICGAEFNHSANLATHTRCVHLQVKPYVCNTCGGRYSKRSQLDDHVLSHSTERQFTCRYCGKSFKYFKGMRRHEKGHTEEESFNCGQCGLKFARKENLDRHKASHGETNFQCKTCKKVLKDGRALQEHEFTHLVAKGCKCSVCGEMFYSSSKYFTHVFVVHNIQKQEAQLMIIDEKLQKEKKQTEVSQNVPASSNSGITPPVNRQAASFDSSVSGILDNASKETMSVLTRVATENLRLHSQDIPAEEKANLIIPPLNPMILYEKNRVTSLDNVAGTNAGLVIGNTGTDSVNFPDHAYGQSMKQQVETNSSHHGNMSLTHPDNTLPHHGLNETVLGFVNSNALTSINNLNSYIGQRQPSMTPLTSLTAGLHQDEHGAIESLRRLQDNPVTSITLVSTAEGMVVNQGQRNVGMSSAGANEDNSQSDYRIQNLY